MAEEQEPSPYVGRASHGGKQLRKRRKDGWSRRDEDAFFRLYRANCNISASARAIGKNPDSAFELRRRSPAFAARFQEVLGDATLRLHGNLIAYAETKGKPLEVNEDGEPIEPDASDFDPQLALQILRQLEKKEAENARRRAKAPVSDEELTAAILRGFDALDRRRRRKRIDG